MQADLKKLQYFNYCSTKYRDRA